MRYIKVKKSSEVEKYMKSLYPSYLYLYHINDIINYPSETDIFIPETHVRPSVMVYHRGIIPTVIINTDQRIEELENSIKFLKEVNYDKYLLFVETNKIQSQFSKEVEKIVRKNIRYKYVSLAHIMKCSSMYQKENHIKRKDGYIKKADMLDLLSIIKFFADENRNYEPSLYEEDIRRGFIWLYKMYKENQPIGIAHYHVKLKQGSIIGGIRIKENFQNQGLGTDFLNKLTQETLKQSDHSLVYVSSRNYRMLKLLEKIGYRRVGERLEFAIDTDLRPKE